MSRQISLREAEKKVYRAAANDGLWDIVLGGFFLAFALIPFLSVSLGDFWSSALLLPVMAILSLGVRLIRKHVVAPRVGVVTFGPVRKTRLARFTRVMLVVNAAALILGVVTALSFERMPGQLPGTLLGLMLLVGFSVAAHLLDFSRLYVYGLLVGLAPMVGEWLFARGYATHHGFPLGFGTAAGIMILVGLTVFVRLMVANPVPIEGLPADEA